MYNPFELAVAKIKCENNHLFFSRYFFKARQGIQFKVNWHHQLICDTLQKVIDGKIKNVVINVPPGSSKTELAVINFIARGLAINPRSRFLHLSGSDSLASLNSQSAREIIRSDEYQQFWPLKIADDANAKKRWNVLVDDQPAGGVYATSLGGQIVGFRAGHMTEGFSGCILIDDPLKPEEAYSKTKMNAANRTLITTVKSRKATPDTPIVIIMQRISDGDPVGFIKGGNLEGDWTYVKIPALIDAAYVSTLDPKYKDLIQIGEQDAKGRFSYWQYKEPIQNLLAMERGDGADSTGAKVSRHVFSSQYQQEPVTLGGNIIKGEHFIRYETLPKIKYRKIFADTAQKTKEANDFSVFECWGMGDNGKIYLLDLIRGKWEAPELQRRAISFWQKHKALNIEMLGSLREMMVEDKSSGTGLIQTIKTMNNIPIKPIERSTDKLTRCMDMLPYVESGMVCVPANADFTNDFIAEAESFTADDSHEHDDFLDPLMDAVKDMLSSGNKVEIWKKFMEKSKPEENK